MKLTIALICFVASALAEAPRSVYYIAAPQPAQPVDLAKATEDVMAQLRAQQGSDSGAYHVYLPDGKLQKVQYTTAPIKAAEEPVKPVFLIPQQTKQQAKVEQPYFFSKALAAPAQDAKQDQKVPSNYVASIQYTDVPPITGPVYSYNPEPLVRIVRYAPRYQ